MPLRSFLTAVVVFCCAACGPEAGSTQSAGDGPATAQGPAADYELILSGVLSDTLRGRAAFGRVVDAHTGTRRFVIALRSRDDPMGGFFLARADTMLPRPGDYSIVPHADSTAAAREGFGAVYREGMRRELFSGTGTLTLSTASDTLLEGSFRVDLRGVVTQPGAPPREGDVRARGTFRAEKGAVGFILGL